VVEWLGLWQGRNPPRLANVEILVFAGNHGVTAQGVSAYPSAVTAQMVQNFAAGGAAINQLAQAAGAGLRVVALDLDHPTADFTLGPAMDESAFLEAVSSGYDAVTPDADLLVLGEMGIGNTTVASALAAALFGGGGARFAGHGTGIDASGLERKRDAIDRALARHGAILDDPLRVAAALGGRELAALLGAALAARHARIPVLLDGFVCTAVAPLMKRADAPTMSCRAPLGGVGHTLCSKNSAFARCSISACGWAKARAPPWPSSSCARASPATPAWRLLPRRMCRGRTLRPWRWRGRRCR
jgi:nicotinate-nucleotide--dimethylbenzimidazole phosphoribosyltransferase